MLTILHISNNLVIFISVFEEVFYFSSVQCILISLKVFKFRSNCSGQNIDFESFSKRINKSNLIITATTPVHPVIYAAYLDNAVNLKTLSKYIPIRGRGEGGNRNIHVQVKIYGWDCKFK